MRCVYRTNLVCKFKPLSIRCRSRGNEDGALAYFDKLKLIFQSYDADGSGEIDESEMRKMLSSTLTIEDPAEKDKAIEDIIVKAFSEIDTDGNETISLEELQEAFQKRPELMTEYFGQNIVEVDTLY